MSKEVKHIGMAVVFLVLTFSLCSSQEVGEKVRYSRSPDGFRREFTPSQDKKDFLPTYNDLAKDRDKGVTREDWQKYLLSEARFWTLDANNDGILSRQELNEDPLQGEAEVRTQSEELITQSCKEIANLKEKLRALKKVGYKNLEEPGKYVLEKDAKVTGTDRCQYQGCQEAWSKSYVQAKSGRQTAKKYCSGHYTLLVLQQYERESSVTPYMFGVVLIGLVVAVTVLGPFFVASPKVGTPSK